MKPASPEKRPKTRLYYFTAVNRNGTKQVEIVMRSRSDWEARISASSLAASRGMTIMTREDWSNDF